MTHAGIMNHETVGRGMRNESRPALECGNVSRATTDSYAHSNDEYGRVSSSSGDDDTTHAFVSAPVSRAINHAADILADSSMFNFVVNSLPIKMDIGEDMALESLLDITYLTQGSNSLIFTAILMEQETIVKVTTKHLTCCEI